MSGSAACAASTPGAMPSRDAWWAFQWYGAVSTGAAAASTSTSTHRSSPRVYTGRVSTSNSSAGWKHSGTEDRGPGYSCAASLHLGVIVTGVPYPNRSTVSGFTHPEVPCCISCTICPHVWYCARRSKLLPPAAATPGPTHSSVLTAASSHGQKYVAIERSAATDAGAPRATWMLWRLSSVTLIVVTRVTSPDTAGTRMLCAGVGAIHRGLRFPPATLNRSDSIFTSLDTNTSEYPSPHLPGPSGGSSQSAQLPLRSSTLRKSTSPVKGSARRRVSVAPSISPSGPLVPITIATSMSDCVFTSTPPVMRLSSMSGGVRSARPMLRADAAGFSVSCMIGRFPRPTLNGAESTNVVFPAPFSIEKRSTNPVPASESATSVNCATPPTESNVVLPVSVALAGFTRKSTVTSFAWSE
mmetsp:Transcript_12707/g.30861  ORF Transcript_12707/g.30861 Transcript_12707/m.30861 type:complete len:413 (-) Transcript_12707:1502-2740(-)